MAKREEHEKMVVVAIDRSIWKEARMLAIQQERPVKLVVDDALRGYVLIKGGYPGNG